MKAHGICDACDAQLERGESLKDRTETRRALMKSVFQHAANRDQAACQSFVDQAQAMGIGIESLLIGVL